MQGSSSSSHEIIAGALPDLLPRLWRLGIVLSRNTSDAEDLVQATCVRALERSHQFKPGTRIESWLFSIMTSIWKNKIRHDAVRRGQGLVAADDGSVELTAANDVESTVFANQVISKILDLPENHRVLLLLIGAEGYSFREAADFLNLPIGTVTSRLHVARQTISRLTSSE